ncbi:hypothetical protein BTZ20_3615 [Rhodococcus sp. MTM3W5.2]|nr:hypothetical protein [Rhodococcus sp. MTM3W5.2]AQA25213.1 hypothetical protein BTZ20_3615 [Rhodococcus sp. MTM3W5.2]
MKITSSGGGVLRTSPSPFEHPINAAHDSTPTAIPTLRTVPLRSGRTA